MPTTTCTTTIFVVLVKSLIHAWSCQTWAWMCLGVMTDSRLPLLLGPYIAANKHRAVNFNTSGWLFNYSTDSLWLIGSLCMCKLNTWHCASIRAFEANKQLLEDPFWSPFSATDGGFSGLYPYAVDTQSSSDPPFPICERKKGPSEETCREFLGLLRNLLHRCLTCEIFLTQTAHKPPLTPPPPLLLLQDFTTRHRGNVYLSMEQSREVHVYLQYSIV